MIAMILFWLFFLSAVTIVFVAGEKADQKFMILLIVAVAATFVLNIAVGWDAAQVYVTAVDTILLLVSLMLVSVTKAHWPIWFSAFQAIVVATSMAQLFFPSNVPAVYTNMLGFWFFPAVAAMVIGVILDSRAKVTPS